MRLFVPSNPVFKNLIYDCEQKCLDLTISTKKITTEVYHVFLAGEEIFSFFKDKQRKNIDNFNYVFYGKNRTLYGYTYTTINPMEKTLISIDYNRGKKELHCNGKNILSISTKINIEQGYTINTLYYNNSEKKSSIENKDVRYNNEKPDSANKTNRIIAELYVQPFIYVYNSSDKSKEYHL